MRKVLLISKLDYFRFFIKITSMCLFPEITSNFLTLSINIKQYQYQSISISASLYESLSILSRPRAFLVPGCFLGSAAVGRRPPESADPSGCPACGRRKRETSLASTPLEGLPGAAARGLNVLTF